jgi:hypothetical protein
MDCLSMQETGKTKHLDEAHGIALAAWRTKFPRGYLDTNDAFVKAIRDHLEVVENRAKRWPIFREIDVERERQDAKWGEQNHPIRDEFQDAFYKEQASGTSSSRSRPLRYRSSSASTVAPPDLPKRRALSLEPIPPF